jgi:hypothetical protein
MTLAGIGRTVACYCYRLIIYANWDFQQVFSPSSVVKLNFLLLNSTNVEESWDENLKLIQN